MTNSQSFCSKITFLYIFFTTSSSATKKLIFECCLLGNDKQSSLQCFHQHCLEKCTVKTTTVTMKTNPTSETSFPLTGTVISLRKWGPICLYWNLDNWNYLKLETPSTKIIKFGKSPRKWCKLPKLLQREHLSHPPPSKTKLL